jgi:hypothetical protein
MHPCSQINWGAIIDRAQTEVRAVGFALMKIADAERTLLVAKIKDSDLRVVLILNNPLAETARTRARDEDGNDLAPADIAKISLRLLESRDHLKTFRKEKRLVVKHVDRYPTIAVVIVDEDLYAYFYPFGRLATNSPILVFRDYKRDELATFFSNHLDELEAVAKEPSAAGLRQFLADRSPR